MTLLKNAAAARLYKQLLREAERFPQYNFRVYALGKIRDEFEAHKNLDKEKIPEFLKKGQAELERLRRMTIVASIYAKDNLVIEPTDKNAPDKPDKR